MKSLRLTGSTLLSGPVTGGSCRWPEKCFRIQIEIRKGNELFQAPAFSQGCAQTHGGERTEALFSLPALCFDNFYFWPSVVVFFFLCIVKRTAMLNPKPEMERGGWRK